jgi:hypothetical protein
MNPFSAALFVPWSLLALRYAIRLRVSVWETAAYLALWCVVYWPLSDDVCMRATYEHLQPHFRNKFHLRELVQTFGPTGCALMAICMHCATSLLFRVLQGLFLALIGLSRTQFMLHIAMAMMADKEHDDWGLRCAVYALVIACRCKETGMPHAKSTLAFGMHLWVVSQDCVGQHSKTLASHLTALMFILP